MRTVLAAAILCLAGCASERLAQSPPPGVDFSGHWKLNEADSDDPRRLIQSQLDPSQVPATGASGGSRGGRGGGRGAGAGLPPGYGAPMMPSATSLGEAVRWPGKELELKQVGGVVAFTSDGYNRVCQPTDGGKPHRRRPGRDSDDRRDPPARGRDMPPPRCGWSDRTLIVQGGDPDDEAPPFEEQYSLSDNGGRLVETVSFHGGRGGGFSMSRVWDRAAASRE